MTSLENLIQDLQSAIDAEYGQVIPMDKLIVSPTKKEFEGEFTLVVFPLVSILKGNPQLIAEKIGTGVKHNSHLVEDFNVVKGFLNLSLSDKFWENVNSEISVKDFGRKPKNGKKMMVEYSSPNTNKPLHLGHIRNILLGWSVSQIAEMLGFDVIKTQIINDRGIAVCKSMMAWKKFANGATPESTGIKGDHFVGGYYVKFDQALQEEYKQWQAKEGQLIFQSEAKDGEDESGFFKRIKNTYFNEHSKLGKETKEMLLRWEDGEKETVALWNMMNQWVYDGFETTYKDLGVSFDTAYYESQTYLIGKEAVLKGIEKNVFYTQEDGSVWIDLEDIGMDKKIVLRSDGTSMYITQDLGTAQSRYEAYGIDSMVYVVGDEQDYHFKVLFEILKRLGEPYADHLFHLSYGMVDLPTGKMKSREGTVVDADDLIEEIISEAKKSSSERGGVDHLPEAEREIIYRKIGLAALKYFIIKVNPRKRMVFDPKESVDMQGTTGPYIQNAYVRIKSINRKAEKSGFVKAEYSGKIKYDGIEKELMTLILSFPDVISEALNKYDPSELANFCYALAKTYHRYYHDHVIFDSENPVVSSWRMDISNTVANVIEAGMKLLGIEMPDYM